MKTKILLIAGLACLPCRSEAKVGNNLAAKTSQDSTEKKNTVSFGLSVSNNGQIEKDVLQGFYDNTWLLQTTGSMHYYGAYGNQFGNKTTPWRNNVCWNLRLQYNINEKQYSIGATVSYQQRYEAYQEVNRDSFALSIKQTIVKTGLFLQKNYSFKKLSFSPGLELPIYWLGQHVQKERNAFWSPQWGPNPHREDGTTTQPGGFISGLNGAATISYSFCKWFSVYAQTSFGLLFAQCGGNVKSEYSIHDYTTGTSVTTWQDNATKKMKRWFFSPPQLGLGILLTI